MGYKTISQIILIVVSIVIIITYIKPTYANLRETKAETLAYKDAIEKASEFKTTLNSLLDEVDNYSQSDLDSLDRYIPDTVDEISVMRDILTIVNNNGMLVSSLKSEAGSLVSNSDKEKQNGDDSYYIQQSGLDEGSANVYGQGVAKQPIRDMYSTKFTLEVTGTYEQFKLLLQDFERNAYPLEVAEIDFSSSEDGIYYSFNLTLETYSLTGPTEKL